MEMPYIGIDLGTTYSCIAQIDEGGNPVIVKNFEEEETTPSVVLIADGSYIVGSMAKEQSMLYDPENTIVAVKRKMGEDHVMNIDGSEYTPTKVSSLIIKKLINDFKTKTGLEVTDAVITVPAYFGTAERQCTINAGLAAGLRKVDLINEPTAAAIAYGSKLTDSDRNILVYDLGGGTFDTTVLHISKNSLNTVCTAGDKYLGGRDWDRKMADLIVKKILESGSVTEEDLDDREVRNTLETDAERHKRMLTVSNVARGVIRVGSKRVPYAITRDEFEEVTKPLLDATIEIIDNALFENKVDVSKISEIILVGGSSRMPQVMSVMESRFPNTEIKLYDPDLSVAKGAALFAMSRDESEDGGMNVIDVLAKTFGIKVKIDKEHDKISHIIYKNLPLPIENSKTYKPAHENQEGIDVEIYESDAPKGVRASYLSEGTPVGFFHVPLPPGVTSSDKVYITFKAGSDGILRAALDCRGVHGNYELKISTAMSKDDIESARKEIETMAEL